MSKSRDAMSDPHASKKRRQARRLFKRQKGLCYWCDAPMIHPDKNPPEGGRIPAHMTTIDHLDDRLSPLRGQLTGRRRRVAACRKCNHERGLATEAALPRHVRRARARRRRQAGAGAAGVPVTGIGNRESGIRGRVRARGDSPYAKATGDRGMTRLRQDGFGGLVDRLVRRIMARPPDFVIGGPARPYLRRWFVIPKNPLFNIYLHEVLRSDDDRALHDHPWFNVSIILRGWYIEHTIRAGGIHVRRVRGTGDVKVRSAWAAHRLEVSQPCITLFLTGPILRRWGFHCRDTGWVDARDFTQLQNGVAMRSRGCGEP